MAEDPKTPRPAADPFQVADLAVAAQRAFNAALRTARGARIPPAQAVRVANDFVLRKLGVDWVEELGIVEELNELAPKGESASITGRSTSSVSEFWEALVSGQLAPLRVMPGLTSQWYEAYVSWCEQSGRKVASLKRFVYDLDHAHSYRPMRKAFMDGMVRSNPRSVLYFDTRPPRGVIESEWLGEQVRACRAMFDSAGLRTH